MRVSSVVALTFSIFLIAQPAYAWKVFKENPFKHPPTIFTHPKKKIEALIDGAKKNVDEISDEWNQFREEKLDPIGDIIELTVRSLRDGGTLGFPERYTDHRMPEVKDPTIRFLVSSLVINEVISEYVKEDIPLDDRVVTGVATNNYIRIENARMEFDEGRNIIRLRIGAGRLGLEAVKIKAGLGIRDAEIELAPVLRKTESGKLFLDIHGRMVYLDLSQNNNWFDRSVAQAVEKAALGKKALVSIDVSEKTTFSMPVINTKRVVTRQIQEFSLSIRSGGWIEVQAR